MAGRDGDEHGSDGDEHGSDGGLEVVDNLSLAPFLFF